MPYKGDTGSREQSGGSISWLMGEVQDHAGRQQVFLTVGHPLLSSSPGHWLRFEEPQPGCQMTTGDEMPFLCPFPLSQHMHLSVCPGEPRPHFTSSSVCLVSLCCSVLCSASPKMQMFSGVWCCCEVSGSAFSPWCRHQVLVWHFVGGVKTKGNCISWAFSSKGDDQKVGMGAGKVRGGEEQPEAAVAKSC